MAASNGTKVALALHGITWALLAAIIGIGVQIRNNDLDHLNKQVSEIRLILDQMGRDK